MGQFNFHKTLIEGLTIIEPKIFGDERGYFMETYNKADFDAAGINVDFVQDNESLSKKGVLRGLHFQKKNPQGKLVRVLEGEVFDVAVDLRKNSSTYGLWEGVYLSDKNKRQLYVPEGFAHGFLVMSEKARFAYKCTRFYDPTDEGGLLWNDPDLNISWPIGLNGSNLIISDKDQKHPTLKNLNFAF